MEMGSFLLLKVLISILGLNVFLAGAEWDPKNGNLEDFAAYMEKRQNGAGSGPPMNPPPSIDPWYHAPDGWETAPKGKVLKTRPEGHPECNITFCASSYQFLYATSDTHGDPSWAVATVFVPPEPSGCDDPEDEENCHHGIVSYAIAYDSVYINAGPSYLLQYGDPYGEIEDMLKRGWFVMTPDYEGPTAAYCAGPQAGHAMLDAIRGALEVGKEFGLNAKGARATTWGYSGGALAATFAAELAGSYAPDLPMAGALIGGPSPNLTTVCNFMNGQDTAGLVVTGLLGITKQWPEERDFMFSRIHKEGPYNLTGFRKAEEYIAIYVLYGYAGQDIFNYFIRGEEDFFSPQLKRLFDTEGQMGIHGTPSMPVFIYKAIEDEMSPVLETDELVQGYCDGGANVLYHRNSIGGHNQELWSGRLRALDWMSLQMQGKGSIEHPDAGCMTKNVTVSLPDWGEIQLGTKVDDFTR